MKFWKILTPLEKENVNFGIYFNVVAIPEGKFNFISTPENVESKFLKSGYCLIRRNDTQILTDISEQFLAGDISASERIRKFQDTIGSGHFSRHEIDKISIVIKTFEEIDSCNDFKKLITLSHIVAEFSRDDTKGVLFKEKFVDKISSLLEKGGVTNIPLVKRFNLTSFKSSEIKLTIAINNWLDNNLFSVVKTKNENFAILFNQLRETTNSNWWTKLIEERIKLFLSKINSEKANVVFNWLKADLESFKQIYSNIDSSKESEKHFIFQLPTNLENPKISHIKEFALKLYWYKFYATLLVREYPFVLAISEQLLVDTDYNSVEGIEIILTGIEPKVIIDFTVSNGDKRLIEIAGRLCHADPSELERIDFENRNWQDVWLNSITYGNKVLDGFKEPQEKIFNMFDLMVQGIIINKILLNNISDTEFGNILNYKNREILWSKLPSEVLTKFLAKTSSVFLELLSKDSTTEVPNDEILSEYIIKYAIEVFLFYNKYKLKNTLPIFIKFNSIPQNYITIYLENYNGEISLIEATQIGKIIRDRQFYSTAKVIYNKSTKSNNWKYALAECHDQLSFYKKGLIVLSGLLSDVNITSDQWWESAQDIIIDLWSILRISQL